MYPDTIFYAKVKLQWKHSAIIFASRQMPHKLNINKFTDATRQPNETSNFLKNRENNFSSSIGRMSGQLLL